VKFVGAANGPLVQIPGTGVIWKICNTGGHTGQGDHGQGNHGQGNNGQGNKGHGNEHADRGHDKDRADD